MGTFGLCDYLKNTCGVETRIFHAGLYPHETIFQLLSERIMADGIRFVGVVLHWKETIEECILISNQLKKRFPDVKIVMGGLTAGYFASELLMSFSSIDFVIKGDAEKPLELLLRNETLSRIPNLIYRTGDTTKENETWMIDPLTLNTLCFADLHYLVDAAQYIERINREGMLGFPVFMGRGCRYNCLFCGGSRKAFKDCGNRKAPVQRSVDSILDDLRRLRNITDHIYLCYENEIDFIKTLFAAISRDDDIRKKFLLDYGTWFLLDDEFMKLYQDAFLCTPHRPFLIEISPETGIDDDRRIIRDRALYYSNAEMLDCLSRIHSFFGRKCRVDIFYSRYHSTQNHGKKLIEEVVNIHNAREHIFQNKYFEMTVRYSHLSTDVGSFYWDLAKKQMSGMDGINILFRKLRERNASSKRQDKETNLCIYRSSTIGEKNIRRHETLIYLSNLLLEQAPLYYYYLTKAIGIRNFLVVLEAIAHQHQTLSEYFVFNSLHAAYVIDIFHEKIKVFHTLEYEKDVPFFDDLKSLFTRYVCNRTLEPDGKEPDDLDGCRTLNAFPILDETKVIQTRYPYLSSSFYRRCERGLDGLQKQAMVNVLCGKMIKSLKNECYPFLLMFNGKHRLAEICDAVDNSDKLGLMEALTFRDFLLGCHHHFTK